MIVTRKLSSFRSSVIVLSSGGRLPLALFLLALIARVLFLLFVRQPCNQQGDEVYYLETAANLLSGQGYRVGHLLAYLPPLYPMLLAGEMALFGDNLLAMRLIQSAIGALMCLVVFHIGTRVYSVRSGVIGSLLCAIYPPMILYSTHLLPEQLFMLLTCCALYLLMNLRGEPIYKFLACGAIIGLAALTKEIGLLLLLAYLLWLFCNRARFPNSLRRTALIVAGCVIIIAPWTVRNYLAFHQFVPITTNSGINFYIGNNPSATGRFQWVLPPESKWNEPSPNGKFEYEVCSQGYKLGMAFASNNPGRFVKLVFQRAYYFFRLPFPSPEDATFEIPGKLIWLLLYVLILISLVLNVFSLRGSRRPESGLLYLLVAVLICPFLLTVGMPPYRLAFMPFAAVIAANYIDHSLVNRFR